MRSPKAVFFSNIESHGIIRILFCERKFLPSDLPDSTSNKEKTGVNVIRDVCASMD